MGKIENTIKDILNTEFNPATLIIENESFMHNVPENSESHFKIILASISNFALGLQGYIRDGFC